MLLPTDILPARLELFWHMPKKQCLKALKSTPTAASTAYVSVNVPLKGQPAEVHLLFDEHSGLTRIEVDLDVSRAFWENYVDGEMEQVLNEYHERYLRLVVECSAALGTPAFSGAWGTLGYPEGQTADYVTYWDRDEGRVQLEETHPDKEFPVFVRIAAYQSQ